MEPMQPKLKHQTKRLTMDSSFFDNYGNFEGRKLPVKASRHLEIDGKELTGWGDEEEGPQPMIKQTKKKISKPVKTLPH